MPMIKDLFSMYKNSQKSKKNSPLKHVKPRISMKNKEGKVFKSAPKANENFPELINSDNPWLQQNSRALFL